MFCYRGNRRAGPRGDELPVRARCVLCCYLSTASFIRASRPHPSKLAGDSRLPLLPIFRNPETFHTCHSTSKQKPKAHKKGEKAEQSRQKAKKNPNTSSHPLTSYDKKARRLSGSRLRAAGGTSTRRSAGASSGASTSRCPLGLPFAKMKGVRFFGRLSRKSAAKFAKFR